MSTRYWHRITTAIVLVICWSSSFAMAKGHGETGSVAFKNDYLVFGFLPMQSPVALFKRFAPLRDYLSTQIQHEIRMETAKSFDDFSRRTAQRRYDIVFTAPHMALQALDGEAYEVAATFAKPLKSVFVTQAKSAISNVRDLDGKIVATPSNKAIVTVVGKNYLDSNGLKSVQYRTYRTHNAAYAAVLGGEADVAVISNFIAMKAISRNIGLKIVAQSEPFPGIGILVARDLPESLKNDLKKAIWSMSELPHGRTILRTIAQPGYIEADKNQFEVLRPFIQASTP